MTFVIGVITRIRTSAKECADLVGKGELPFHTSSESWSHSLLHYQSQSCLQTIQVRAASLSTVLADGNRAAHHRGRRGSLFPGKEW